MSIVVFSTWTELLVSTVKNMHFKDLKNYESI